MFNILAGAVDERRSSTFLPGQGILNRSPEPGSQERSFCRQKPGSRPVDQEKPLRLSTGGPIGSALKRRGEAIRLLHKKGDRFDLIFMDPPYGQGLIESTLSQLRADRIYHDDSLLIVEHIRREPLPDLTGSWDLIRQRKIGTPFSRL